MKRIVPRPESITLDIDGLRIAGIRHRDPQYESTTRLLCLHGWLDNANSFLPLMPLLPEVDLVAIDLPGHGFSDHLNSTYSVADTAYWATACIHALGWDTCHVAGHSLGGIIAPLVAIGAPEQVQSLIIIEASGAMTSEASSFAEKLRDATSKRLETDRFQSRIYADKNAAVDARLRSAKMTTTAARLIIDRQLQQDADGWRWRFDPKLRMPTAHRFTEEHVLQINRNIPCAVLGIVAGQGFLADRADTQSRLAAIPDLTTVMLNGNHHLHMDTPEPVATAMNQFLGTTPDMGG